MFESWPNDMAPPTRMVVDPPLPVLVDLTVALNNPDDKFRRDTVALRIKAQGINTNTQGAQGLLYAWMQSTSAGWWGLVSFDLHTGDGRGHIGIQQWCPARSLQPAPSTGHDSGSVGPRTSRKMPS